MNSLMLTLTWVVPLLLLPLTVSALWRWSLAISAVPALLASVTLSTGASVHINWLLLGTTLRLDEIGQLFLMFSSLLWIFAGAYAAITMEDNRDSRRFSVFYLLACAGNLLLILAGDMVSFYVGFAIMGLAATGLVAHRRSQRVRRATKVYLGWTLVGELAIFAGILMLAFANRSLLFVDVSLGHLPDLAGILLLLGFGVKVALPGLHFWLPLTYPAAPAAAAAVLSGPMISAGLLGWLRFLPPGDATPFWAEGLVVLGVVGTALGLFAGLAQRDPRAVLAYSSIAKMGLLASVFGMALLSPEASVAIVAAMVMFAMHHLILKGTLFLGLGEWERKGSSVWVMVGIGVLALAMIGVPLSSGAGAKLMLKESIEGTGFDASLLFGFSSLGTALLMARLFWLLRDTKAGQNADWDMASLIWVSLALTAILLPLSLMSFGAHIALPDILLAGIAALAALKIKPSRSKRSSPSLIPPGDLLMLVKSIRQNLMGRSKWHEIVLSPRALLLTPTGTFLAYTNGALVWLVLIVLAVTIGVIPGMGE